MNVLINTSWMKSIISKIIKSLIAKKAGIKADFKIDDIDVADDNTGVEVHLDATIFMTKDEFVKLLDQYVK